MLRRGRSAALYLITLAGALSAAPALAGTDFVTKWASPEARPGTFQGKKVVGLLISDDEALRRGVETSLARELTKRGADGVAAYMIIPTADMRDEAKAKALIEKSGASGLVALRLVGSAQEVTATAAEYWSAVPYQSVWNGYWGYGWGGIYVPSQLHAETVLRVETLVYSLEQNKLVWAGQSKTTDPKDANEAVKQIVSKAAGEIKKAGLVQKSK